MIFKLERIKWIPNKTKTKQETPTHKKSNKQISNNNRISQCITQPSIYGVIVYVFAMSWVIELFIAQWHYTMAWFPALLL